MNVNIEINSWKQAIASAMTTLFLNKFQDTKQNLFYCKVLLSYLLTPNNISIVVKLDNQCIIILLQTVFPLFLNH